MLMQLTTKDRAIQIKKYEDKVVSDFLIRLTLFYRDSLPYLEYNTFDAFHATGILTLGAIQFEKMTTQSKKDIPVNYSDDNWYADIYHYYTNQEFSLSINRIRQALIKKKAKYYRCDALTKQLL